MGVLADRDSQPPGAYRRLVNQTHLQSAVEHLNVKFSIVGSAGQDAVYVYGMSSASKKAYVIRLNRDREITAYSAASVDMNGPPIAMLADKSGVWILTRQRDSGNKQVPGVERVRFANQDPEPQVQRWLKSIA